LQDCVSSVLCLLSPRNLCFGTAKLFERNKIVAK
jgi:hypothetical protein